jgi:hypothetical protein
VQEGRANVYWMNYLGIGVLDGGVMCVGNLIRLPSIHSGVRNSSECKGDTPSTHRLFLLGSPRHP